MDSSCDYKLIFVLVFFGSYFEEVLEYFGEIFGIVIFDNFIDFVCFVVGGFQQFCCMMYMKFYDIIGEIFIGFGFEEFV